MGKRKLQIDLLDRKIKTLSGLMHVTAPSSGWVKAVRSALGITLQQLGSRLSISRQAAHDIEARERDGSITLKALREAAEALDMQLVYGLIPRDGSLQALIKRRARELATEIVLRTAQSMKLENQEISKQRLEKSIEERTESLVEEMPGILWGRK